MFAPLKYMLNKIVRRGDLRMIDASGKSHTFGDGTGKHVVSRILDKSYELKLAKNPALYLGESYMKGRFVMESGSIYDFLEIILSNAEHNSYASFLDGVTWFRLLTKKIEQYNPVFRARRNVSHHYDISNEIYDLFLDSDKQYSCAYFDTGTETLEQAQLAKKRHLAAKLDVKDGQKILDIGSGWGGLGLYLAGLGNVNLTGITLSTDQLAESRQRADRKGLTDRVSFEYKDYRNMNRQFDRIVSVGMFEHVGTVHYATYFRKIHDLLSDDDIAVVHSIGRFDRPTVTNPFISKYIFPGGYIPALSEVLPAIEKSKLYVTDIEILRLHYAETLRRWRRRFCASWPKAAEILDENFCRMWEFYLAGSEAAFRYQKLMVFQIQLTKKLSGVPLTRDYMFENEQKLRAQHLGDDVDDRIAQM